MRLERAALEPRQARALAQAWGVPARALLPATKAPEMAYARARGWAADALGKVPAPALAVAIRRCMDSQGPAGYRRRVRQAQRHILDGDIYQANLAHQIRVPYKAGAFDLYRRLTKINPSPMAAYVD
ncbi:MAG: chorismate-binding protein, partial [Desulfobaccales bacterium]